MQYVIAIRPSTLSANLFKILSFTLGDDGLYVFGLCNPLDYKNRPEGLQTYSGDGTMTTELPYSTVR